MTVGELQKALGDIREDVEVVMDFNGDSWTRIRSAVVSDGMLVLTNVEDYET